MIGQYVYVNRPENNAYAEVCRVEKTGAKDFFKARSIKDGWAHFFTLDDIDKNVFLLPNQDKEK